MSLKYHPELCKLDNQTSNFHFCEGSEAYEVLSDNLKRALYDKYGEEVLKEGILQGGHLHGGYRFKNKPLEIFEGLVLENNSQS